MTFDRTIYIYYKTIIFNCGNYFDPTFQCINVPFGETLLIIHFIILGMIEDKKNLEELKEF